MILLPVPGAALGRAEIGHDLEELIDGGLIFGRGLLVLENDQGISVDGHLLGQ